MIKQIRFFAANNSLSMIFASQPGADFQYPCRNKCTKKTRTVNP